MRRIHTKRENYSGLKLGTRRKLVVGQRRKHYTDWTRKMIAASLRMARDKSISH